MKIYSLLSLVLFTVEVSSHSNMLTPQPRGNTKWWGYCSRGNGCNGACDAPKAASPFNSIFNKKKYVKRGEEIPVEWLRQNHPGGFVRIAFAPMDKSDDHSAFDQSVAKYVCYETNCKEDYHEPILGELNGPGFKKCSTTVKIPNNIPDGPLTIQWTWFGGGVLFADRRAAFANYISCSDMMVQGGEPLTQTKNKSEFKGGDVAYKGNDKCRYWSTNSVFGCPLGAEDNNKNGCGYGDAKFGPPAEWEKENGNSIPSSAPSSTPSTATTPSSSISSANFTPVSSTPSVNSSVIPTQSNIISSASNVPSSSVSPIINQPTGEPKYPVSPPDSIVSKEIVPPKKNNLTKPSKKCKPKVY